jgi:hypothetical protein
MNMAMATNMGTVTNMMKMKRSYFDGEIIYTEPLGPDPKMGI